MVDIEGHIFLKNTESDTLYIPFFKYLTPVNMSTPSKLASFSPGVSKKDLTHKSAMELSSPINSGKPQHTERTDDGINYS